MAPYRFALALLLVAGCGGKIDPSASDSTRTKQVGGDPIGSSGAVGSSSGGGSSSSGGPASTGPCGGTLIPFTADFEDGVIGDQFTVNSPSAFTIEWDNPVSGSASLRVDPNQSSYLARKVSSVCAARLEFTIRASKEFLAGGGNLARINAGSRRFTVVMASGGSLSIAEEIYTQDAIGMGYGPPIGSVFAEDPTTIVLDVDLPSLKVTFGFHSAKAAGPTRVTDMQNPPVPLQSPAAITSVELGTTPGIASNPKGLYWIDDISID